MGRKKKLKPIADTSNSSEEEEFIEIVVQETIQTPPPKPLHWSEIGSEEGYDRNLEIARVYNEFIQKQQAKSETPAAPKPASDSAKEVIFRSRNSSISDSTYESTYDSKSDSTVKSEDPAAPKITPDSAKQMILRSRNVAAAKPKNDPTEQALHRKRVNNK